MVDAFISTKFAVTLPTVGVACPKAPAAVTVGAVRIVTGNGHETYPVMFHSPPTTSFVKYR